MKIKLLSAAVFVLCSSAAFSQGIDFGLKAGTDIHKMSGKSFDEEFKFGYHVGAFVEIKLKNIGIQPEVYFSQVNAKNGKDVNSVLNGIDTKIKLSYLNIPIMLNLKFNKNVAFQLGPQFGILVSQDVSIVQNGEDAFKKGDFSLAGGLQFKFSKLRIYGRYVIGLNDLNDINSTEKWRNQTVHLGVGYAIL